MLREDDSSVEVIFGMIYVYFGFVFFGVMWEIGFVVVIVIG